MPALAERNPEKLGGQELLKRSRTARMFWLLLGLLLLGVGFVGVFLPLLPTVDFLILALACFARSSPRLEAWLLNHPRFGPGLRAWREERAISRKARITSWCGMAIGYGLFMFAAKPGFLLACGVGVAMLASALWVASRPLPSGTIQGTAE
ncbi:MAG: YbaN family protein [Parasphingorhabdus sp.]